MFEKIKLFLAWFFDQYIAPYIPQKKEEEDK